MRFSRISLLICCVSLMMFHSCSRCSRTTVMDNFTIDLADLAIDSSYINMAQTVFYALPTPVEMSMMIKSMELDYQAALLNDPGHVSKYLSYTKMALNFGVYTTDLTYAGLFEQSQTVLHYKNAIQQLTESLGLQSAIDVNTLKLLEENINDRSAVLRIVSDVYASCMASLTENERYSLTLAMIVGGWVEGMYIASSMVYENLLLHEDKMKQLVVNQILTFDMIWQVMSDLKTILPDVAALMNDLSELAQLYERISVTQTQNDVALAHDGKTSQITSSNIIHITPEAFAQLKNQILILRQNITKI